MWSDKKQQIEFLSQKYKYSFFEIFLIDIQRHGVNLRNYKECNLLPEELKKEYRHATLIVQANSFTFTLSDPYDETDLSSKCYKTLYSVYCNENQLELYYENEIISIFNSFKLIAIIGMASDFYYPFKNQDGTSIKKYLVINPYKGCVNRCKGCSRLSFLKENDYKSSTLFIINNIKKDIDIKEIEFINIITGTMSDSTHNIKLFSYVIDKINEAGYINKFGIYTSNVFTNEELNELRNIGVCMFTYTADILTDSSRLKVLRESNDKIYQDENGILQYLDTLRKTFDYLSINLILGYDDKMNLISMLNKISKLGVGVNHYIPRIYMPEQDRLLSKDATNLEYFVELSAYIERIVNKDLNNNMQSFFEQHISIPKFTNRFRS